MKHVPFTLALLSSALLATACSSHSVTPSQPEPTAEPIVWEAAPQSPNMEPPMMAEPPAPIVEPIDIAEHPDDSPVDENLMADLIAPEEEAPYLIQDIETQDFDATDDTRPAKTLFLFGFDQKNLDTDAETLVREHGQFLAAHPNMKIQVNGHADPQGDPTYNQFLAKQRADYVAKVLAEEGVQPDQLEVLSWGADAPTASATHHRDNRRVELIYEDAFLVNYQGE